MKNKKTKNILQNQNKYFVSIYWSSEDDAFVAKVPELPGCATHGSTFEEAAKHVQDAIATWLEGAIEAGIAIPEPINTKKYSGKFMTRIDPDLHRVLALYATRKNKSLNSVVQDILKEKEDDLQSASL